ncbi:MAG: helix-turn-helix transcriptional regulator [Clostridia bacterium]|nr:helix-turn-helix transcriptional regulator [Clostridia bacterium]
MDRETVIAFYISLMEKLRIPVHRFIPTGKTQEELIAMLSLHGFNSLPDAADIGERTFYVMEDAFGCRHILARLPGGEEMMLVSPYVTERVSDADLMVLMERSGIEPAALSAVRRFYDKVPVMPSESALTVSMQALGEALWGKGEDAFRMETLSVGLKQNFEKTDIGSYDQFERKLVEERYEVEARLMNEVAHGHSMRAAAIMSHFDNSVVEQRSAVPLRNFKNYLIISNTLMRKAVQQGGVHPLYIDKLSSSIARRIEAVMTMDEGKKLASEIVRKYCLLVRNHAMKAYSPLVRKVILAIDSDLTADLSLCAHAKALGVNASYLSALFRRETGQTLSDYVARARVEQAIFLLNTTHMQIQTIAQHCGMPDVNYFTRTFRRIIGITPSQYRRSTQSEQFTDHAAF